MTPQGNQIRKALLEYFYNHPLKSDGFNAPPNLTQEGISRELGVNRSVLCPILRILCDEGMLTFEMLHTGNYPRRVRTYCLTAKGWDEMKMQMGCTPMESQEAEA